MPGIYQPFSRSLIEQFVSEVSEASAGAPAVTIPASAIAAWAYFNKPANPAVRGDDLTLIDQKNTPGTLRARKGGNYKNHNGTNQYISVTGRYLQQSGTWTVVLYFRTSATSGTNPLWDSTFSGSDRNGASISGSTGAVSFGYYNGSYVGLTSSVNGFNDGKWHVLTCENVNTVQKLWVDGILLGASGAIGNLSASQAHSIGYASNGGFYTPGDFSHLFHYDRVLTPTERMAFVNQMLTPWVDCGIPTDVAMYLPLETDSTDRVFGAGGKLANGVIQNYAAGYNKADSSAPFSAADLWGYGTAYRYNGIDNFHTSALNGSALPATGSLEIAFTLNAAPHATVGYYCGLAGAGTGRFGFGVNSNASGSGQVAIAFQNLTAANLSQGASGITGVLGRTYRLRATWNGSTVLFDIDNGSGYSNYRNMAYSGGFASQNFLIGVYNNNGVPSFFSPFTVHLVEVRNGSNAVVFSTNPSGNGFGTPTLSPVAIRTPVLINDKTKAIGGAEPVAVGPAPFDGTISGYTDGENVLESGQSITVMPVATDPVLRNQEIPAPYAFNAGAKGSLRIAKDTPAVEGKISILAPWCKRILTVGNSLSNNAEPKHLISGGVLCQSTHSNTPLGTIASAPTTNLTAYSYRWDLALADTNFPVDCLILQPFTADTPNTATTGSSPTFGSELAGARTIIDAAPASCGVVIIYTGWNRQGHHATDYTYTRTFVDADPMVYCPDFFNQFVAQLQSEYPSLDIRLCDVLGVYEYIYQDVLATQTYYTAWSQLYSDGTHATATSARIGNAALRRTIKPNGVSYPPSFRAYPWASVPTAEANFQDTAVAAVVV